ncbi:MAG: E3 ubiquitin ligase family protein [Deltaproteobacteria bacterium]|nr:E3 ubiquitin ligase family protein [Deltaproteobacteria bacterium]
MVHEDLFIKTCVFCALSIPIFVLSVIYYKRKHLVDSIPSSKIASVAVGLCELRGYIQPMMDIVSPLSLQKCCFFKSEVYKGHGTKRRKIYQKISQAPFQLFDETGCIIIDPIGIEVDCAPYFQARGIECLLPFSPDRKLRQLTGQDMLGIEWLFKPGDFIYIIGFVEPDYKNRLVVKKHSWYPFFISNQPEKKYSKTLMLRSVSLLILAVVMLIMAVASYLELI